MTLPDKFQIKRLQNIEWSSKHEKDFETVELLGEGSYGSVFHAIHKPTNTNVAVKTVKIDGDASDIEKENNLMKECDTDFIVRFFGHFFVDKNLWIVMEICGAGSVSDIMHILETSLAEEEIQIIIKDTLKGLAYLHAKRMIHRDIKAANILVSSNGVCKLADFGVSTKMGGTNKLQKTLIGTPYWMAPEVILESGHNELADIWSVGITAIEMFDGKPPHSDLHPMRAIFLIPNRPPPTLENPEEVSKQFNEFIKECCVKDFRERKGAKALLETSEFLKPSLSRKRILKLIQDEEEKIKEYGSRKAALGNDDEDEDDDEEEEEDDEEEEDEDDEDYEDDEDDEDDDGEDTMVIRK